MTNVTNQYLELIADSCIEKSFLSPKDLCKPIVTNKCKAAAVDDSNSLEQRHKCNAHAYIWLIQNRIT
jgi:hypothetical protein